ncbi:MAG: hypothetical protein SGJ18_14470 [Pseudomonadota bacterium]|nr:hypothetical protein [Pseudomonadota bacterium]
MKASLFVLMVMGFNVSHANIIQTELGKRDVPSQIANSFTRGHTGKANDPQNNGSGLACEQLGKGETLTYSAAVGRSGEQIAK